MRHVLKNLADPPAILIDPKTLDQLEDIAKGQPQLISDSIYKGTYKDSEGKTQSSVRDKLNLYYYTKCSYCETSCKAEIEHYRPKKGVAEDNLHLGYYWLCYEWSNLLPSCRYCNTEGGKGNKFPILGKRVKKPNFTIGRLNKKTCNAFNNPLFKELPYLLHPEIDNPKRHFEFFWDINNQGIRIKEKHGSNRAKETIDICNLNREYLRVDRLKDVLYPFKNEIDYIFELLEEKIVQETDLLRAFNRYFAKQENFAKDLTNTHTLLRWYIFDNVQAFENIIGPYIPNGKQRQIVIEAFKYYKRKTI